MDIQQLRQSLKMKWLNYYKQNRHWLIKLKIWRSYDGLRRPSSGYMLAVLSVIEPKFEEILAFILELNTNPDQIITALGLHFNPDEELGLIKVRDNQINQQVENYRQSLSTEATQPSKQTVKNHQPLLFKVVMGGEQKRRPVAVVGVTKPLEKQEQKSTLLSVPSSLPLSKSSTQTKTVPFPSNGSFPQTYQPQVSSQNLTLHYTNAKRLESWLDEFCPGVGGDLD